MTADLETDTREDITEALAHAVHDAKRVTVADHRHARIHAYINFLLDQLERTQ